MAYTTHDAMPMYTHDQATYIPQMHDWRIKMSHYHDQLRAHHLERAKHFHGLMGATTHQISPRPEDLIWKNSG
jgi:hypothetical protein